VLFRSHIDAYADLGDAARRGNADGLDAYLKRHILAPDDQEAYVETVGGPNHMQRLEQEARDV